MAYTCTSCSVEAIVFFVCNNGPDCKRNSKVCKNCFVTCESCSNTVCKECANCAPCAAKANKKSAAKGGAKEGGKEQKGGAKEGKDQKGGKRDQAEGKQSQGDAKKAHKSSQKNDPSAGGLRYVLIYKTASEQDDWLCKETTDVGELAAHVLKYPLETKSFKCFEVKDPNLKFTKRLNPEGLTGLPEVDLSKVQPTVPAVKGEKKDIKKKGGKENEEGSKKEGDKKGGSKKQEKASPKEGKVAPKERKAASPSPVSANSSSCSFVIVKGNAVTWDKEGLTKAKGKEYNFAEQASIPERAGVIAAVEAALASGALPTCGLHNVYAACKAKANQDIASVGPQDFPLYKPPAFGVPSSSAVPVASGVSTGTAGSLNEYQKRADEAEARLAQLSELLQTLLAGQAKDDQLQKLQAENLALRAENMALKSGK